MGFGLLVRTDFHLIANGGFSYPHWKIEPHDRHHEKAPMLLIVIRIVIAAQEQSQMIRFEHDE